MGNELSVIIPTIQKKPMVLEKLVGLLDKDESVTEILIINNRAESPLEFAESISVQGTWMHHASYGEQFKAEAVERRMCTKRE